MEFPKEIMDIIKAHPRYSEGVQIFDNPNWVGDELEYMDVHLSGGSYWVVGYCYHYDYFEAILISEKVDHPIIFGEEA